MKAKLIKFLKIALPLALGVFLISYSYHKFSPEQLEEVKAHFKNANYYYVALSLVFAVLSHLSRAWRWQYQLEPLGYKPRYVNSLMAVLVTYLMNLFIPRSGEISRALVLDKYEKIPFEKAFGTIIAERVADLLILIVLIGTAFFLQFDTLYTYLGAKINPTKLLVSLAGLSIIGVVGLLWIFNSTTKLATKLKTFVLGIKDGISSIIHMKKKWAFIAHTIFIWVMYICMFYTCIYTLPQTSGIDLSAVITTFVVGSIAIAFTNGGFGTYPFLVAEILLLFQIPETVGTAFGWIVWTSQTVLVIISGALAFLFLPIFNKIK